MAKSKILTIVKISAAFIPLLILVYMHFRGQRIAKEFYEKEFSATVVNFSNWQGRSTDFYLNNKITLNFSNPVDGEIEIGDSIRKSSNTYIYSIYRKQTEGSFELIGTYDYRKRK